MNETSQQSDADDLRYAQRDLIRQSLNEIANDLSMEMRDAALDFPVYMTVPNSGHSLATIATPLDPSDQDWEKVTAIVCRILERRSVAGDYEDWTLIVSLQTEAWRLPTSLPSDHHLALASTIFASVSLFGTSRGAFFQIRSSWRRTSLISSAIKM